jgi:hypothetical protein
MPSALPSADEAQAMAQEILARSEYARFRRTRSPLEELVDDLADWFRWLGDLTPQWVIDLWQGAWQAVSDLFDMAVGDDALVVLLRLALALAVLGTFGLLAHRVWRELRERQLDSAAAEPLVAIDAPRFIADAEAAARTGRFLDAAHSTQLATLQLLLAKHWLELERSDPNRTLRRRLAEASLPEPLRDRFLTLLDRLEGRWFRDRSEDRDLYSEWRALHASVAALPESR